MKIYVIENSRDSDYQNILANMLVNDASWLIGIATKALKQINHGME